MFRSSEISIVKAPEIIRLMQRVNSLTEGDEYERYDSNIDNIERLLDKILMLARQKCEWNVYFVVFNKMFMILDRSYRYKKLIKYAELFFKDEELHFDEAFNSTTEVNMGYHCVCCYNTIFRVYRAFLEVSDEQIYKFSQNYRRRAFQYGYDVLYCQSMLRMALEYNDKELAKQYMKIYNYKATKCCYLCAIQVVLGYYLLIEDYKSFECELEKIRTHTIPVKYRWSYTSCLFGKDKELVTSILGYCIFLGKAEYFHKFLEENKNVFLIGDTEWYTNVALYYVYTGNWDYLEEHIELMENDTEDWKNMHQTVWGHMLDSLDWYIYFILLDRHGQHSVKTRLAGKEVLETESGMCDSIQLAAYFEKEADLAGRQMAAARSSFNYELLKQSFKECFDI